MTDHAPIRVELADNTAAALGIAVASHDGRDPVVMLAGHLIEAGTDPRRAVMIFRSNRLVHSCESLAKLIGMRLVDPGPGIDIITDQSPTFARNPEI
jgi:hypothetical protein